MKTVAIVGMGLIGGSLGMALRKSRHYRVIGIARKAATIREAKRRGAIDEGSTALSSVQGADIIVLAVPIDVTASIAKRLVPFLKSTVIVTDVGSVKDAVIRQTRAALGPLANCFIGAHPLAGSHKTGVQWARKDLFEGAICIVTPLKGQNEEAIKTMWRQAGARLMRLSPQEHDRCVAFISHVPHLVAHAMVQAVASDPQWKKLKKLVAGSFRDLTRVAAADPDQWAAIFHENSPAVRAATRLFQSRLKKLSNNLTSTELARTLKKSSAIRRPLFHGQ